MTVYARSPCHLQGMQVLREQISSTDACRRLVRRALTNFRVPYITITPVFSICPQGERA